MINQLHNKRSKKYTRTRSKNTFQNPPHQNLQNSETGFHKTNIRMNYFFMADYDQKSNTSDIQLDMHQNILELTDITSFSASVIYMHIHTITTKFFHLKITYHVKPQTINPYSKEMRNCKDDSLYLPPRLLFSALKSHGLGFSSSLSQDLLKLKTEIKKIYITQLCQS